MSTLAPIVLFVYNRPQHVQKLLESLSECRLSENSELFVFADGPKADATTADLEKIKKVRELVQSKRWCMKVHIKERETNLGLADSIVSGISEIIQLNGKIIVLEDDLILSPGFLEYMNYALSIYENDERVMHISGFMYPVKRKLPECFFVNTTSCWGWATWSRAWKYFNPSAEDLLEQLESSGRIDEYTFNNTAPFYDHLRWNVSGKIKTWAIKWHASVFLRKGFCLHPFPSLVRSTGNDETGTHGSISAFNNQEITDSIDLKNIPVEENIAARKAVENFYKSLVYSRNIFKRIIKRFFYSFT